MKVDKAELFPVVDESGNVIGSATRGECHSGAKLLHPVVHLHVIDERGRILLQKRSMMKDIQPGRWDTAVGGHVDFGETVHDALLREVSEEIGIDASAATLLTSYLFESAREREMVNTFILHVNADARVTAPADEIDELRFWHIDEIEANLANGIFTPNFVQEFTTILLPHLKS